MTEQTAPADAYAVPPPQPIPAWLRAVVIGRTRDAGEAADVLQEVALAEARADPAALPPPDARGPWLYRVAVRQAALLARSSGRRRRRERHAAVPETDAAPPPAALVLAAESRSLVRAALAELPAADRDVLVLTHLEGRTRAAAAATLGVSVHCVDDRLRRARGKLRRALARRGVRDPS